MCFFCDQPHHIYCICNISRLFRFVATLRAGFSFVNTPPAYRAKTCSLTQTSLWFIWRHVPAIGRPPSSTVHASSEAPQARRVHRLLMVHCHHHQTARISCIYSDILPSFWHIFKIYTISLFIVRQHHNQVISKQFC